MGESWVDPLLAGQASNRLPGCLDLSIASFLVRLWGSACCKPSPPQGGRPSQKTLHTSLQGERKSEAEGEGRREGSDVLPYDPPEGEGAGSEGAGPQHKAQFGQG